MDKKQFISMVAIITVGIILIILGVYLNLIIENRTLRIFTGVPISLGFALIGYFSKWWYRYYKNKSI